MSYVYGFHIYGLWCSSIISLIHFTFEVLLYIVVYSYLCWSSKTKTAFMCYVLCAYGVHYLFMCRDCVVLLCCAVSCCNLCLFMLVCVIYFMWFTCLTGYVLSCSMAELCVSHILQCVCSFCCFRSRPSPQWTRSPPPSQQHCPSTRQHTTPLRDTV